ncbi:histidine kinase [Zobellia galactanivorans]|uniref:tetratricopeptide repeat-containing sensor histidine kinase n=1 Tax=Zobellia galactanivorans (strain DSM 12802 / CCUG 47099 / CIP 106680 / NCIMB 13871 / Dsij) TaxID=63186 RepID=UPI001C07D495|nr:histidine kinase [Zobellia galactanivorans]MBU3027812.1 histidine kinase [Zobellia galactanivorans]MDO6807195.1 histidine kinase [Zobellia galactanivorans]
MGSIRHILLFLFIGCSTISVWGQKELRRGKMAKPQSNLHQVYLDSANVYRQSDIERSIDYITNSIAVLGKQADKKSLSESLVALGEVYQYHNQYDLAITNYIDALEAYKSTRTTLLLAEAYIQNKQFSEAETVLLPLLKIEGLVPYQKVRLNESLGDAYRGLDQVEKALAFFEEGLIVAKKNQITPKLADLNSKIADTYAQDDKLVEAGAYYNSSLQLTEDLEPKRAVQEKEKVADFYNQKNLYGAEIELRKKSLSELKTLPKGKTAKREARDELDSITPQRINYKIANAYIAQDKYDEAIPYLKESIETADSENDLVVQKDATRKLSEVFEYKGDYPKAFETYRSYVSLVDTLYVRKEQEIARAARFNREISMRQNRISGLEQERELSQSKYDLALTEQQLIQESNKRQRWIIYSLIFGMILLGLAAFFFYRSNQQQKLANNLLALKSLRSQMNPHFIFNALNSVNNYIAKSDERSANRFLSEFSTLMRSVLENSEEDFIPLAKELEQLELYVKLEHSRFPDKFDYQLNVDKKVDVSAFEIPPMLLQPYIENAIWHGLRYKEDKGRLTIDVRPKGSTSIEIVITDDGIGRKKSGQLKTENQKKQKSKGMGNIKKRIAILNDMYKNKVDVTISDLTTDGSGTKVIFVLRKD